MNEQHMRCLYRFLIKHAIVLNYYYYQTCVCVQNVSNIFKITLVELFEFYYYYFHV